VDAGYSNHELLKISSIQKVKVIDEKGTTTGSKHMQGFTTVSAKIFYR
jgi:hypothetical protein